MAAKSSTSLPNLKLLKTIDLAALFVARHWLALFVLFYGFWVLLPFTAPVLMRLGAFAPGQAVYFIYSFFCHQLPERSIFFFGPQLMYSYADIARVWSTADQMVLRQFVGNPDMGWKMAWSDRMISTYGGVWLAGLVYALLGRRAPRVPLALWLVLGVLPLGLDGLSHFANDVVAGTSGAGFRDTNEWLALLTGHALPATFYAGDEFGSFNSWMRWMTGLLFSFTTVFAIFPVVQAAMDDLARDSGRQLDRVLTYRREQ